MAVSEAQKKRQEENKKLGKKPGNKVGHAINGSFLDRLIKNSGFTYEALSNLVPCSKTSLHNWVTGQSKITKKKLNGLAAALDVDPCALLEMDDQRTLKYLRDLINKKIEHDRTIECDLPLIDIPTLLSIAKILGYTERQDIKVSFDPAQLKPRNVDAEEQMNELLGIINEKSDE